jgi:NIPSNAP protein
MGGGIKGMIHEFRRYRMKTGMVSKYLEAFEQIALPLIQRHMNLLGFWTSDIGELSYVFHLWEFENHQQRSEKYAALRSEPQYRNEFMPLVLPLVEEMHSTVLMPVSFSKLLPLQEGVEAYL